MTAPTSRPNGWAEGFCVARFYWHRYVRGGALWALFQALPLLPGLALREAFDRLTAGEAAGASPLSALAVLAGIEFTRAATLWSAVLFWPRWWSTIGAWLRGNLLGAVLQGPGPPSLRLPGSAGEAVGRFRDDVDDIIWLVDGWVDLAGAVVLGAVGVAIMVSIDALFALAVVVPLVTVLFVTRWMTGRLRRLHRGMRQAGASVTSFVADVFASATTLKTAGAEDRAIDRLRTLNAQRGDASVRAQVAATVVQNLGAATAEVSTGLVLLLSASALRRGDFTVGDLALFTSYASALTFLPRRIGQTMVRARAAGVATERVARFLPCEGVDGVYANRPVYIGTPAPTTPLPVRPDADALRTFSARGLATPGHGDRRALAGVDLDVAAGEFVVLTGAVGAGKSTLVRALLGLAALEHGTVEWNGRAVTDPSLEMVSPRVAYVPQVPRLFSSSLTENVTLGWPADEDAIAHALRLAALERDVAEMPDGLNTLVGPRGMRLSGGQAQRTAAARALVRSPDLLVVDDLSSALDPRTETQLWAALARLPGACLAVSHRSAVLERADRVIVLDRGRVVGSGPYEDLVRTCAELQRLLDPARRPT